MIYAYHKNELYHHGILGQKWGKRNGPPYPLDAEDHSAAEKKATAISKASQIAKIAAVSSNQIPVALLTSFLEGFLEGVADSETGKKKTSEIIKKTDKKKFKRFMDQAKLNNRQATQMHQQAHEQATQMHHQAHEQAIQQQQMFISNQMLCMPYMF